MEVLKLNRNFLILLGVFPTDKFRILFQVIYFLVLLLQVLGLISSVWFICKFLGKDLDSVLYAGFHTSAYSTSTYSLLVGYVFKHKIVEAFRKLQANYDDYHAKDPSDILLRADESAEWITEAFMKFLTLGYFCGSISLAVLSASYSFFSNGSVVFEQLYVPFKFILPWDQQTVRGWIYETIFSVISSSLYLFTNVMFLTCFIAFCQFHQAILNYFEELMKQIQKNRRIRSRERLCEAIHFQITAKRFFWETADIYSLILLTQLVFTVLHMTCSVFQMDMAIKHPDLNFYMVLMSLLVSGANLFLYCFYGNRTTNDFERMSRLIYESNWNEQPVELQKYVKMMIANAQRPIFYHGFKIVHLNLETYLKLLKTVVSYYLMFKTIATE